MTWTSVEIVDKTLKLAALIVAGFGIYEYFDTIRTDKLQATKQRSLEYIDRLDAEDAQNARKTLGNFWSQRPAFRRAVFSGDLTAENYSSLLVSSIIGAENSQEVLGAIYALESVYSGAGRCLAAELCDSETINGSLCLPAKQFLAYYQPALELIAMNFASPTFYQHTTELSNGC